VSDLKEFQDFPKIPRLTRECIITEKIDGTNAQVCITDEGEILTGSRTRWITPLDDNFGFASWVLQNKDELIKLGPGRHFGEWWGGKIQRGYGLKDKKFSLFNTSRWTEENLPSCCSVVPILYKGLFDTIKIDEAIYNLRVNGSKASPGFMKPEGVVIYHIQGNLFFKKTLDKDEEYKGKQQ
jgi:hypothetical protein